MVRCVLKVAVLCIHIVIVSLALNAQDLRLSPADLRIELRPDGGYHLFIRCRGDISSVLITESTRDPTYRAENYAYRAVERNSINGDEIRLINGSPISAESRIYSLVSSTPVWHPNLGWAFHIYIPITLLYGYEGGRQGEVQVGDGTYLNIRAFNYAYADYRGTFRDNPFILRISQETQRPVPPGNYMDETVKAFFEIAGKNTVFARNPANMLEHVINILEKEKGKGVDIAIVLDVTGSMRPYFNEIRQNLVPTLKEMVAEYDFSE
jgi:hypothetical protein